MPYKTHLSCSAEYTSHGASRLAAHARGVAATQTHQHRLNRLAVREAKKKLSCESIITRHIRHRLRKLRLQGFPRFSPISDPLFQRNSKILLVVQSGGRLKVH